MSSSRVQYTFSTPNLVALFTSYHDWMLEELQTIDKVADGNRDVFLQMFEDVKTTVKDNSDMLRKTFWE